MIAHQEAVMAKLVNAAEETRFRAGIAISDCI